MSNAGQGSKPNPADNPGRPDRLEVAIRHNLTGEARDRALEATRVLTTYQGAAMCRFLMSRPDAAQSLSVETMRGVLDVLLEAMGINYTPHQRAIMLALISAYATCLDDAEGIRLRGDL